MLSFEVMSERLITESAESGVPAKNEARSPTKFPLGRCSATVFPAWHVMKNRSRRDAAPELFVVFSFRSTGERAFST